MNIIEEESSKSIYTDVYDDTYRRFVLFIAAI